MIYITCLLYTKWVTMHRPLSVCWWLRYDMWHEIWHMQPPNSDVQNLVTNISGKRQLTFWYTLVFFFFCNRSFLLQWRLSNTHICINFIYRVITIHCLYFVKRIILPPRHSAHKRAVMRSLRTFKLLNKPPSCRWYNTLWRTYGVTVMIMI